MKLAKRLLAGSLALIMAAAMASCDKGDGDSSSTANASKLTAKQEEMVKGLMDKLPEIELENKTIKWLAHYDINPADGKAASPALTLFQKKYGGKIESKVTTYDTRYDDLATAVMSGQSPDFFPADDMDTFPKGAIKKQFEPIDDYIDYNSELWADTKDIADQFSINGKHYIAVIQPTPSYACFYNKTTIEDEGFEQPADLFEKGEWDWDIFEQMCLDFTNADEDKYALDGYWYNNAISESCGVPIITMQDGKVVQNMSSPEIEKIQSRMYDLQKNEVVFPRCDNNWNTRGNGENGDGLGSHKTLFIPIGIWAIEEPLKKTALFGDMEAGEIMFVPMPKNPASDTYYISARINGYNLCYKAPNPEGFAAYMTCVKTASDSDVSSEIFEEQLRDEYKWNDEMIAMRKKIYEMTKENPVFDIHDGVSSDLKTIMNDVNQATMITGGDSMTWTECRTSNEGSVKYLIKEANDELAALK